MFEPRWCRPFQLVFSIWTMPGRSCPLTITSVITSHMSTHIFSTYMRKKENALRKLVLFSTRLKNNLSEIQYANDTVLSIAIPAANLFRRIN